MKAVLLILGLVTVALALSSTTQQQLQYEFTNWMQQNDKSYSTDEFQYRFQTWKQNALFIQTHNANNNTYTVAMNQFGDLTTSEWSKIYKGFNQGPLKARHHSQVVVHANPSIPASVDWRTHGAVTGIKNQGQCGSCWSFSTTGSTEGAHKLQAKKELVGLSEQNLVDCSGSFGNQGCNGGLMDDAFRYIISNKGIDTEASYPYHATDGVCKFKKDDVAATLVNFHDIQSGSEADLTDKIAAIGPISVAIDASHSSFQFYSSGVYNEPACSSTVLDHGVLAIGYGTDGSTPYYLVKNSWGTDWGQAGYIWMSRDRKNQCGIATAASYPCATDACKP